MVLSPSRLNVSRRVSGLVISIVAKKGTPRPRPRGVGRATRVESTIDGEVTTQEGLDSLGSLVQFWWKGKGPEGDTVRDTVHVISFSFFLGFYRILS